MKIFEPRDFFRADIEDDHIRATQPHLRSGNKQNAHCRGVSEHFLWIKDGVMQRDCKNAKSKRARPLQQLMGGIINRVFGIIKRVDVKIHFDPILMSSHCTHTSKSSRKFHRSIWKRESHEFSDRISRMFTIVFPDSVESFSFVPAFLIQSHNVRLLDSWIPDSESALATHHLQFTI